MCYKLCCRKREGKAVNHYKKSDPELHTATWERLRAQVIQEQPKCAECMRLFRMGVIVRPKDTFIVHHIIPRSVRPDLTYVRENLEGLCFEHHEQKHPERRQRTEPEEHKFGMRVEKV